MAHLSTLIAEYTYDIAREKTSNFTSTLKTYKNKKTSVSEELGFFFVTSAFIIQASCKRFSNSKKEEEKLSKESLKKLREAIKNSGGQEKIVGAIEEIIEACEKKLSKDPGNTLPLFYFATFISAGVDTDFAESYINELTITIEALQQSVEKYKHLLEQ